MCMVYVVIMQYQTEKIAKIFCLTGGASKRHLRNNPTLSQRITLTNERLLNAHGDGEVFFIGYQIKTQQESVVLRKQTNVDKPRWLKYLESL